MNYLASLMAIRFLGLFIVMPLLSLYAMHLKGATNFSVGIALGAYALSQMAFQIPFGKLADKYNKKVIIAFGLFLLFLGSLVCAFADNIYMLIFGRLLQGAGAIGGVVLAYMSELVDENSRAKIFARMGQFIALSFAISMILGPTVGAKFGVDKLFLLTALLALLSILILNKVPKEAKKVHQNFNVSLNEIFKNKDLVKLFFSGFMQKFLMSLFFMLVPILFTSVLHWDKAELWKVYIPALVVGIFALPLGAILAEKKQKAKLVFILSSLLISLSLILLSFQTQIFMVLAVILFFFGFNLLEPVLQSFVSKIARFNQKATALSTSNTIQYFGIFLGGALTGYFVDNGLLKEYLIGAFIIGLFWVFLLFKMKAFRSLKVVEYKDFNEEFIENLKNEKNVYDFYERDGVLIVRYI